MSEYLPVRKRTIPLTLSPYVATVSLAAGPMFYLSSRSLVIGPALPELPPPLEYSWRIIVVCVHLVVLRSSRTPLFLKFAPCHITLLYTTHFLAPVADIWHASTLAPINPSAYSLCSGPNSSPFHLRYSGAIRHPPSP